MSFISNVQVNKCTSTKTSILNNSSIFILNIWKIKTIVLIWINNILKYFLLKKIWKKQKNLKDTQFLQWNVTKSMIARTKKNLRRKNSKCQQLIIQQYVNSTYRKVIFHQKRWDLLHCAKIQQRNRLQGLFDFFHKFLIQIMRHILFGLCII